MEIKFDQLSEFQKTFIIHCFTHLSKDDQSKLLKPSIEHQGLHVLKLTDNGIELDPLLFINRIEEQMKRMISEEATRLVEDKARDLLEPLEEAVKEVAADIYVKLHAWKSE